MGGYAPRALKDSVRPRRLSGASGRPLDFTVRAQMRGLSTRRDNIASLVMGIFGVLFFAWALASVESSPSYMTLWLLGSALGALSSALAPQRLFRRITSSAPDTRLPRGARICASLSALCLVLALVLWLARAS